MAITNGYCTLVQVKTVLDFEDASVDDYDTELELVIESVSRLIDDYCQRRFYSTTSDETKYYTPRSATLCQIDECLSITTLKTDPSLNATYTTTWTTDDYYLFPYNSTPKTHIEVTPLGDYVFYKNVPKYVEVVGKFGYCDTDSHPKSITQACVMQSARIFKRRDSILGIAGTTQFGLVKLIGDVDPDVKMLLRPYVRYT